MNYLKSPSKISSLALLLALLAGPAHSQQPVPGAPPAASDPSPLPRAGASEKAAQGSAVGASRNPFHPHTSEMLRQSNRLKAKGYVGPIMNDGEITLALDSALRLVSKAELETRGHRTKAIGQIDLAIKHLNTKAAKSVATTRVTPRAAKGGEAPEKLTQARSDEYLQEARKSLTKILAHMNSDGNARRHASARAAVGKAIEELNFALEGR